MKCSLKTKLRIRFVLLAVLGIFVLLSAIVSISIYNNYSEMVEKSDMIISGLHHNPSDNIRYFSVKIPSGRDEVYPDTVQHVSVSAEEAGQFAHRALNSGKEKGFVEGYRYCIYRNESGIRIYFLSRTSSIEMCKTAAENLILVSVLGLLGVALILIPLSGWIVAPLLENHRKQKRFITAAGHELKTPLTVISTNTQLLALEIGSNDWLDSIQKQVSHLTQMTHDLVALSKAEEYDNPLVKENFSFTDALADVTETYEVIAKQKRIQFDFIAGENITYSGSKAEVQQLVRILLDNACKYCVEDGRIQINARKTLLGVQFVITNTAEQLREKDANALLGRFCRGENAAGKDGFGLGLSIAEAIANRHNGRLTVSTATEGEFCVEVVLR